MLYPQELEQELRREFENNPAILRALDTGSSVEDQVRKVFERFNTLACKGQKLLENLQTRSLKNRKEALEFREFQETVDYWNKESSKYATLLKKLEAVRVFNTSEVPSLNRRA